MSQLRQPRHVPVIFEPYDFHKLSDTHCFWKLQMDGQKNAETSNMDFHTQLVTLNPLSTLPNGVRFFIYHYNF